MRKVWRLIVIFYILFRYGLDEIAVSYFPGRRFAVLYRSLFFWRRLSISPRGTVAEGAGRTGAHFHQVRSDALDTP